MRKQQLQNYIAPETGSPLELKSVEKVEGNEIVEGTLCDQTGHRKYLIHNAIPRFVKGDNYSSSFGIQWNRYRRVQLDSVNGSTLTRDRFWEGTGWTPEQLKNKRVLGAGCGAGRFSEIMLQTGAQLYSFDFSSAVDAARLNHSRWPNHSLCQADIYSLPFKLGWFDYIFCYGVLQHTPDPKRAFLNLTRYLKPGGQIAIDVYARQPRFNKLAAKYLYRPLTKHIPHHWLLRFFEFYLPFWILIDSKLQMIPKFGKMLSVLVPCWNKSDLPISPERRTKWTILDTFDAFSPQFDQPSTVSEIQEWFQFAGMTDFQVGTGGNGILGNGCKQPEDL